MDRNLMFVIALLLGLCAVLDCLCCSSACELGLANHWSWYVVNFRGGPLLVQKMLVNISIGYLCVAGFLISIGWLEFALIGGGIVMRNLTISSVDTAVHIPRVVSDQ